MDANIVSLTWTTWLRFRDILELVRVPENQRLAFLVSVI